MISRSWPMRIIDLIRLPALLANSSILAPFANPPAIQITLKYESSDAKQLMRDVVMQAKKTAKSGDTVLLAPACASMDQFDSYVERGQLFAQAVKELV